MHGYHDAGPGAQPEVKKAIDRFRLMSEAEREKAGPLLYWILGQGTPAFKMGQGDTEYTDRSEVTGQTCGNCEYAYQAVVLKKFICSQIEGFIKPPGWCNRWMLGEK